MQGPQLARQLNVHPEALRNWIRRDEADRGERDDRPTTIRDLGARAGVALNPPTPLEAVTNVLYLTDLLLVMMVDSGFGGQPYPAELEPKIAAARAQIDRRSLEVELEVDGGITTATIGAAARAGATAFCAGSALFNGPGTMTDRVAALREPAAAMAHD